MLTTQLKLTNCADIKFYLNRFSGLSVKSNRYAEIHTHFRIYKFSKNSYIVNTKATLSVCYVHEKFHWNRCSGLAVIVSK